MIGKMLHVIAREYSTIVRTKGFIISTALMPLFMAAIFLIPIFSAVSERETQRSLGVADASGVIFDALLGELADKLPDGKPAFVIEPIPTDAAQNDELPQETVRRLQTGDLDLALSIPEKVIESGRIVMYSRVTSNITLNRRIQSALRSVITNFRLSREGFQPEVINRLMRGIDVTTIKVGKEGMEEEEGQTMLLTVFMVLVLYMSVIMYGASVMRSVLEEKTTRVIEILISSLKPFQIMFGKLLGVSLVGITQYIIWGIFGLLLFTYGNLFLSLFPSLPQIPLQTSIPGIMFFYFVLFFFLGYLLYATLFAVLGAVVTTEQEAQQLTFPLILPLIIPMLMLTHIQANPDSALTMTMSFIPLFSPLVMMARISLASPPLWEIVLSIGLLCVSVVIVTYIAGRIYRIGILMYGKKPSLMEVIKWIGRS